MLTSSPLLLINSFCGTSCRLQLHLSHSASWWSQPVRHHRLLLSLAVSQEARSRLVSVLAANRNWISDPAEELRPGGHHSECDRLRHLSIKVKTPPEQTDLKDLQQFWLSCSDLVSLPVFSRQSGLNSAEPEVSVWCIKSPSSSFFVWERMNLAGLLFIFSLTVKSDWTLWSSVLVFI